MYWSLANVRTNSEIFDVRFQGRNMKFYNQFIINQFRVPIIAIILYYLIAARETTYTFL